jgi:signal transduction histidine kinase
MLDSSIMPSGLRSWGPLVLAGVLAALLLSLASLQWRWLGQISAGERDRMKRSLRAQADEFTQEFDRELTRAYFWLQADRGPSPVATARDSVGHFQRWFTTAPHPGLVRQIFVVSLPPQSDRAGRVSVSRYDKHREALESIAALPAELAPILVRLRTAPEPTSDRGPFNFIAPVASEGPALVIPRPPVPVVDAGGAIVFSRDQRPWDYTIVVLDTTYMRETFLPELLKRHFGEARGAAYRVSIVERASKAQIFCSDAASSRCPIAAPDESEGLFDVRLREFNRFVVVDDRRGQQARTGHEATPRTEAPVGASTAAGTVREGVRMLPPGNVMVTVQRERGTGGERRPERQPLWRADFAHQAGSLEAVVASTRRRNLFVSSSVLLLLGASIGMLVVSSARARKLAAQQMEFVAGVSHELRTPLAVIRSAAENLADGVVADAHQVQRYGQLIADEGRRLTEMVEQVMEFAGFDAGRTLDVRPLAAMDVVQAAIDSSDPLLSETEARLDVEAPDGPLLVQANHAALARSIQNLISNAVKYGGPDRWVGIRIKPADGRMVGIAVSDHGSGIPESDLTRIFEPFYRGQRAVDGGVHGSGLGLSLVDRIARQHGGRVHVHSTSRGTTFTLLIPAAPEAAATIPVVADATLTGIDARRGHAS